MSGLRNALIVVVIACAICVALTAIVTQRHYLNKFNSAITELWE